MERQWSILAMVLAVAIILWVIFVNGQVLKGVIGAIVLIGGFFVAGLAVRLRSKTKE